MTSATSLVDAYRLADPAARRAFIHCIVQFIPEDEAAQFIDSVAWRKARFDILGNQRMPAELQLKIADNLDFVDIWNCTMVCRNWRTLLLNSNSIVCYMLAKWFPAHNTALAMDQNIQLFSKGLRKRYLRVTGRFQWR